jgi:hypothetical protein
VLRCQRAAICSGPPKAFEVAAALSWSTTARGS